MSRWSRLVCIWCLALVLPLQGLAAGCRLPCAATHAPAALLAVAPGIDAAAQPCHGAAAEADGSEDGIAAAVDGAGAGTADTAHRCSACAACCAAFALPAEAPVLSEPDSVRESLMPPSVRLHSVVIAGLERPPRAATC